MLNAEQPIFVQASNDLVDSEAKEIIEDIFRNDRADELKYTRLRRGSRNEVRVIEFVKQLAKLDRRAAVWFAHKEFALLTLIVDWWIEPFAHENGINLYKNGANLGMSNMLYYCLEPFEKRGDRRKLLLQFQRMLRAKTEERFIDCQKFVEAKFQRADKDQKELLMYMIPQFDHLGMRHIQNLPHHVLDLALPGLAVHGHTWRQRKVGPWSVQIDRSSNLAKQQWIWDLLSSPYMGNAIFQHQNMTQTFPMNVGSTNFVDSKARLQIQIADILAGVSAEYLRAFTEGKSEDRFIKSLSDAGLDSLFVGHIWPEAKFTPEELGRSGWDGAEAIEWLSEEITRRT